MNIENFLKKYKTENNRKKNNRADLFKFNEYNFDGYDVGTISNLNDDNKYEVFLYVEANHEVASSLLLKEFDSLIDSTAYFEELSSLAKEGNLDKISHKIDTF